MAANLLALPYELRERILLPCLRQKGTIEIQYPVWADKAVFTQPLTQVCRQLREECIRLFYRANVFVWVIDMDEVCDFFTICDPVTRYSCAAMEEVLRTRVLRVLSLCLMDW